MIEVLQGDCLDVLPSLREASVDSVVTSPPYAMQRASTYGGVPEADYPDWTAEWMRRARPSLKPDGSVLINIREHIRDGEMSDYVHRTRMALRADGWIECDELIWDKKRGAPFGNRMRPTRSWERILWFSPGRRPFTSPRARGEVATPHAFGGTQQGHIGNAGWMAKGQWPEGYVSKVIDIARISPRDNDGARCVHPAAFPRKLADWMMALVTPPGGTVLDPFGGSGTTGVAALMAGFDAVLIEREPEYVEIARARIAHALADVAAHPPQLDLLEAAS